MGVENGTKSRCQNIELNNLVLTDNPIQEGSSTIENFKEKVKEVDIPQLKIFIGIGYFVVMVVLTLALLL